MRKPLLMSTTLLIAFFVMAASTSLAADGCLTCHELLGEGPTALFKKDVHHAKGISCAGCHGGNPRTDDMEKAMDKSAGFIGVPKGDDISKACARCHADPERMKSFGSTLPNTQFSSLQSSVHGSLSGAGGRGHLVQCTTCHGAHGILPKSNPASPVYPLNVVKTCTKCHADAAFMRAYNPSLPVDQLEKYKTSVHGMRNAKGDPKVAECASCHGSHDILSHNDVKSKVYPTTLPGTCASCHSNEEYMAEYHIPTDQYAKFAKSVHGIALLEKHDTGAPACNSCHGNHGAAPPGLQSISNVCGTCHALNADLFASSPHKKAFDAMGLPECETCHGNHEIIAATNQLLGVSEDAVCSNCHSESDNRKGYVAAKEMRSQIDSLEIVEQQAKSLIEEAEQKGMEVSEAKYKLRDVRQSRLESRTVVHAFNEAKFDSVVEKGVATASMIQGEAREAIHEYYFRRIGLGIATIIITLVAVSLYVYIRRLESKKNGANGGRSVAPKKSTTT